MPPDIVITLRADDLTSEAFQDIKRQLLELGRLEERVNQQSEAVEVSRNRKLRANARTRRAAKELEIEQEKTSQAEIRKTEAIEVARHTKNQANANARAAASRREQAEWRAIQADIEETGRVDNNFTRRYAANQARKAAASREATAELNKETAEIRERDRAEERANRKFVQREQTKLAEINKTSREEAAARRFQLQVIRDQERERDRRFRREERVAREQFAREGGVSPFAAGLGAGLFSRFQQIAGSIAVLSGGFYAAQRAFSSVIRDRARVQRLEVGVRDLTDTFRQQQILPRLQEIALLPGLDYVTATSAFTRALSGGFSDQQSLRLIDQIRNAVALSQGSIEDTNEVLRQFIQIQARDRFDQENLRPILERAPFIRRVIQAEFGTQIGGEIQQVIERRGLTTTEGILRIVERLAAGPVADPTTLQNALDNVGNELILLRNELGRRIEPQVRALVDVFTNFLRFSQGPTGQILTAAGVGGSLAGAFGIGRDLFTRRQLTGGVLATSGFNRFALQQRSRRAGDDLITAATRIFGFTNAPQDIRRDTFYRIVEFLRDPAESEREITAAQSRFRSADALRRTEPGLSRGERLLRAGVTQQDLFIQEALLLNERGDPSARRRLTTALFGRRGTRLRPFDIGRGNLGGAARNLGAGLFTTPGLIAAGVGVFGGATLGTTAFEAAGRGEANALQRTIVRITELFFRSAGDLTQELVGLSDAIRRLVNEGVPNFEILLGDAARATVSATQLFGRLQAREGTGPTLDLATTESRQLAVQAFTALRDQRSQAEQQVRQLNTERENVQANIRRLEQRLLTAEPGRRINRGQGRIEFRQSDEERRILEEITQLENRYQAIRRQQSQIIRGADNLRERYEEITDANALRIVQLEDIIGKTNQLSARTETVRELITRESLDRINLVVELFGGLPVTIDQIAESFREVSNVGRLTFRTFTTGLGELRNVIGTRRSGIEQQIEGIIPREGRELPEGGTFTPGVRRPGDTGRRQLIRTAPDFFQNLGTSADQARSAVNNALDAYRRARTEIQSGAPPDPRNPAGVLPIPGASGRFGFNIPGEPASGIRSIPSIPIIPRPVGPTGLPRNIEDEVPDTRVIDNINANRRALERLGESFQDLQRTAEGLNRERGLFDFARPDRIRDLAQLIAQTDQLRSRFEELRPAIQSSIDALPENNPLRAELQRLIDVPVDELTRRIMQLRQEIGNLASGGSTLQTLRDQLNRFLGSVLGNRQGTSGLRAFGRQFGALLGNQIDAPRGREIFRQRRLERAQAFSSYIEGSAESIYDQFIAPPILDSLGIGEGQLDRGLRRLREDVARLTREIDQDERLSTRDRNDALLELRREHLREVRDLEREYEQQREDAWANWVRQQLTDFPKLIFQQLNLQLAARATNAVLNSLGLGGNIPITGPGIGGGGSGIGQAAQAGGVGLGTAAGTAGVAFSAYQAGRGIYEVARGGGYNDIFRDIANIPSSIGSFFSNLSFHNPINDAFAFEAGRQRSMSYAARLGRQSAQDIVRHYDEGYSEGSQSRSSGGNTYVVDGNTEFRMPLTIGEREIREISFTMDEMVSTGRLRR